MHLYTALIYISQSIYYIIGFPYREDLHVYICIYVVHFYIIIIIILLLYKPILGSSLPGFKDWFATNGIVASMLLNRLGFMELVQEDDVRALERFFAFPFLFLNCFALIVEFAPVYQLGLRNM